MIAVEGLKVGDEVAGLGHVPLGHLVVAAVDVVVRTLEQTELAVLFAAQTRQCCAVCSTPCPSS